MRFTPTGAAVCSFSIATNRTWTPADGGEKQERADYHNIVAWSKLAEICGQFLHKGDKVYVEGRLQTREWQNKEGQDQRTTEVIIDNMIILTARGGSSGYSQDNSSTDVSSSEEGSQAVPASAPAKSPRKKAVKNESAEENATASDEVSAVEDISEEVDIPF